MRRTTAGDADRGVVAARGLRDRAGTFQNSRARRRPGQPDRLLNDAPDLGLARLGRRRPCRVHRHQLSASHAESLDDPVRTAAAAGQHRAASAPRRTAQVTVDLQSPRRLHRRRLARAVNDAFLATKPPRSGRASGREPAAERTTGSRSSRSCGLSDASTSRGGRLGRPSKFVYSSRPRRPHRRARPRPSEASRPVAVDLSQVASRRYRAGRAPGDDGGVGHPARSARASRPTPSSSRRSRSRSPARSRSSSG